MEAPPGIGLYTIGDRELLMYDQTRAKEHKIEHLHDGGAKDHGLLLGSANSSVNIEGVSG